MLSVGAATGANEDARVYRDMKESFLATLARAKGERGVLTDQDVKRVEKALPSFGDTEKVAQRKLIQSRKLLLEILGITESQAEEILNQGSSVADDYSSWMN